MFSRGLWSALTVRSLLFASVLAGGLQYAAAQSCIAIVPSTEVINFGQHAVGTTSLTQDVEVTNLCSPVMQVNTFTLQGTGFVFIGGWAPINLAENQNMIFQIRFAPSAAQTYTGTATLNVQGYNPIVVTMSGTGFLAHATPSWSASSLTFSNVPVGTTSATQSVTLTNTGTQGVTITDVYTDPPFSVPAFTGNVSLKAKASITYPVTYTPWLVGSNTGTLVVTTNNLPPTGLSLYGTAVAPTTLAITNFPTLPPVTQGAAYLAQFLSTNGIGAVTWTLATGSSLPSGLSLSSTGSITGAVASTVPVGNYPFSVTATDSSLNTVTMPFTIAVEEPTGASCNNISWDVAGTTTPIVPLPDLGTGTYLGSEGGLYLDGSNVMPSSHDADGVAFAQAIQPLDVNGNPSPTGKIGLMSMGMSVTFDTFLRFIQNSAADPSVNPNLVYVPAAQPRLGAVDWANINNPAWVDTFQYFLPQSGLTPQQVQVAWIESVDANPKGTFPGDMTTLQSEFETAAQLLHTSFPNLTLAFFSSREYGGYEVVKGGDKEPYAYESGFAVRGMIQDQLNGVPAMNYNAANGPVMAPWVAWGPYIWANGLIARSDGLVWPCYYFESDGQHPSSKTGGSEQDANMLMNFLKTDDATAPWFLAPAAAK
jgi:hypothetical protein